ncbi:MAG: transaldolase family protein [Candidatus Binatia bacterium]
MEAQHDHPAGVENREFDDTVIAFGTPPGTAARPQLTSAPLLAAVCRAGTTHIYGDTADAQELGRLITTETGAIVREVDGNTANQPLVHKVIKRYLEGSEPATWARQLRALRPDLSKEQLHPLLYAIVCGRIGNDAARAFGAGRAWEVSLQLHMGLGADPETSKRVGRYLRRMVPSGVVKVPFTPQAPHCFLIARDLEREGIPVNFTSTFSARQAVAAGLLSNVTLTNIFMGRLNQGLKAALLGEHVDLEAQRALRRLRREAGIKTLLIVASVREWQTFVHVAGCDVFTAPLNAIRGFLQQTQFAPEDITSRLETSYADTLGVAEDVLHALGTERLARLYTVEPELIEFLRELRATAEYRNLRDGDQLFKQCDQAGFGDLFYAPSGAEWRELRKGKLPDLQAPLTSRLPIDTLYSLLADADFEKYQKDMDTLIEERIGG